MNTLLNFGFPKMVKNFLVADRLVTSQEGLSSMELVFFVIREECYCRSLISLSSNPNVIH
jgi:hypothetical protein